MRRIKREDNLLARWCRETLRRLPCPAPEASEFAAVMRQAAQWPEEVEAPTDATAQTIFLEGAALCETVANELEAFATDGDPDHLRAALIAVEAWWDASYELEAHLEQTLFEAESLAATA